MSTLLLDAGMVMSQELNEALFGKRLTSDDDLSLAPKMLVFNSGDFLWVGPY